MFDRSSRNSATATTPGSPYNIVPNLLKVVFDTIKNF